MKVRRRNTRLFSCSARMVEDDASVHVHVRLITIHGAAFPASPSAAAFVTTQHVQKNVHQAIIAPNSQHTVQDSSDESIVPVPGGWTKDCGDWWREQCLEQSNFSLFNIHLVGDASSPQVFTSMAHNDLAYCWYACCLTAWCRCLQQEYKPYSNCFSTN